MFSEKTKQYLIYLSVLAIVVGGILYFEYYNFNVIKNDYNDKILQTLNALKSVKSDLEESITALGNSTGQKINMISSDLESYKLQNQKSISSLSDLIRQIEEQSNLKLKKLSSEIKDIQVKSADFSAIIDDVLKSVVSITTNKGLGSGVIIRDGFVVTNYHVIKEAGSIKIQTYENGRYNAEVIGFNADYDIAVLKVNAMLPALEFGNSDDMKPGSKVIALGNPAGLSFTVTEGIISAQREFNNIRYLQVDVPINPGNSGGPLVNQKGEIVGINNFKVGGFESLGFAIASNEVYTTTNSIIENYNKQK